MATASTAETVLPVPAHAREIIGLSSRLFALQDERAGCAKRSKEINAEMHKIKTTCARWMLENEQDELESKLHGRKLVKSTRNIKKKTTVEDMLEWLEQDSGVATRRRFEQRIKQHESQIIESRQEYRITYSGVRKKNQRVAPDDGSSASKRPRNK